MSVLGILALGAVSGGSMRPLLLMLLALAILLLLAGAVIALVTLRNQRRNTSGAATLERSDEVS